MCFFKLWLKEDNSETNCHISDRRSVVLLLLLMVLCHAQGTPRVATQPPGFWNRVDWGINLALEPKEQEFLSQTNHNAESVSEENRFHDLTTLENIKHLSVELQKYDFRNHFLSDVPVFGYFVNIANLKSHKYLNSIITRTINHKMKINIKKTKAMLDNFTKNHQFITRIHINNVNVEIVDEIKILDTIVTSNVTLNTNKQNIIKKVNKRMLLLKKIQCFGAIVQEMVHLWIIYCRSVLKQLAVVWGSSLTSENKTVLDRTQKSFSKMNPKNKYTTFEEALWKLNFSTLEERRKEVSLKNEKFKNLFPKTITRKLTTGNNTQFKVTFCNTNRSQNFGLTEMKYQLNEHNTLLTVHFSVGRLVSVNCVHTIKCFIALQ